MTAAMAVKLATRRFRIAFSLEHDLFCFDSDWHSDGNARARRDRPAVAEGRSV